MATADVVVLQMFLHYYDCPEKIRRALRKHPGVKDVAVSSTTGMVFVFGRAADMDVEELRWRLLCATNVPATVVTVAGRPYQDPRAHLVAFLAGLRHH